ncbi:DoxX family protein [Chitinophaga lutea]
MGNTLTTDSNKTRELGFLILRVGIGILFFFFGWQKLAGGEPVWTAVGGSMGFLGISAWPTFWGFLASVSEFLGGLLLIFGLWTRLAGLALALTMIVAVILKINVGNGMVDVTSPLTMLIVNVFFFLHGGGAYSADRYLKAKKQLAA